MQVDPLSANQMAIYQYSGNNPVMFNDPMGDRYDWKRIQAEASASEFFRESERRSGGGSFSGANAAAAYHDMQLMQSALEHGMPWAREESGAINIYTAPMLNPGESLEVTSGNIGILCSACGDYAGTDAEGNQYYYNTYRELQSNLFTPQGGVYTINQVLNQYGYPSREEYLFPKPTFLERLLNFGVPLDRADLAEKIVEAVGNEWDLIHENLDAVDLGRLKLYKNDLWSLRFNLMTKMESLEKKITQLQQDNWMAGKASEIRGLGNLKWDIEAYLVPVNKEFDQVSRAINFKIVK